MKSHGWIFGLLLACWLGQAAATPLHVGVEQDSPLKWQHPRAPVQTGFCPDLLSALSRKDPQLQFAYSRPLPQKRIEMGVADGELDLICGLARTPERELRFQYVNKPIYLMHYVLVVRADDPVAATDWDSLRALGRDGIILLNYDSSAISRLSRLGGLHLDHTGRDIETNLRKLKNGRGRFFYYTLSGAQAEIQRLGLGAHFRLLSPPLETVPFHLLTGRHVAGDLRRRLQAGLQKLEQSGELQQLRSNWGI